jgi:hypothetical protein
MCLLKMRRRGAALECRRYTLHLPYSCLLSDRQVEAEEETCGLQSYDCFDFGARFITLAATANRSRKIASLARLLT